MKNDMAVPFTAMQPSRPPRAGAHAVRHKRLAGKLTHGVAGILAEVAFALGLTGIGLLISLAFGG